MNSQISIKKMIERISSGDIRIPAFQRDYVWEPDQVAFLLDSIYKNFPIGVIILWRTEHRLKTEKNLGYFELPEPRRDYPVNYVLDGQQRLTSLFSVFQTDLEPVSDEWVDIYFDMNAEENIQESMFLALDMSEVDPARHFPVKTLFDSVKYRRATQDLSEELIVKIDKLQEKFKEYFIPSETFETDDLNKVAIVFERINRAGTELNTFELLSAWSWSSDFDLVEKFEILQENIVDHGFDDLCDDRGLLLRICAGIISGETTPKSILDLKGEEIRSRFTEIENGILGALDFLKRELQVEHFKMLPFPGLLVPLSSFFATLRPDGHNYSSYQKEVITRWFWRSIFSRRYSASVNARQAYDIEEMNNLKRDKDYKFNYPPRELKFDYAKTGFSASSANSKAHILLLNSLNPKSLLSGAKLDLDKVLKKGSKHEYHHIFPKKFLERKGYDRAEINVLSNICFLTRSDNNSIKDKDPSVYGKEISEQNWTSYLEGALIPSDFDKLEYAGFITKRTSLLVRMSETLML